IKYSPTNNTLRGFSANLSVTYAASTPTEAPNAGDTTARVGGQVIVQRSTNQWRLRAGSYTQWNLGARYRFANTGSFDHMLAINVNNMFDKEFMRANKLL